MGEKGIGRLAIAAIGPQVLVLTRAGVSDDADLLVAAFIHWGVFTLPAIDLNDVRISVRTFPGGTLPTPADIASMVDEVRTNIIGLAAGLPDSQIAPIVGELGSFGFMPEELYGVLPPGPTLLEDGRGTHFIIRPCEPTLPDDIDGSRDDDTAPPLIKVLIGFSNTMTSEHASQTIRACFRDHALDGIVTERIAGSAFFTPEEFRQADHHVSGDFDEFGQFRGSVAVYGGDSVEYLLPWPEAGGNRLSCGPLKINFAYVQGEARATKLPPEVHAQIVAKLNRIGGLYIYRDGIRILPYGNSDYDFLNIEQRRTKSAGYYFFSYRRIFGVIDISRQGNPNLVEKAGREGFRENRAYRQLKRLLEHFFVQLAAEFFREGGLRADDFITIRKDLETKELLRRRRAQQVRVRRLKFQEHLDSFFQAVNAREPDAEAADLLDRAKERIAELAVHAGSEDLPRLLLELESNLHSELTVLDEKYRVTRPRGFGFTRQLRRDWDAYRAERARLETDVFRPAGVEIADLVSRHTALMRIDLDHRRRLTRAIKDTSELHRRKAGSLRRETQEELVQVRTRVLARTRDVLTALETEIRGTISDFERTDTTTMDSGDFESLRTALEARIVAVADVETNSLEMLREQLRNVGTEQGLVQSETTDALEEELEVLRERDIAGLQLAQVGMALGIVHHEFSSTIQAVRNSLRRLKPWADANSRLNDLYREIRSSFDHLDGYLTLFTPLDKRLQRRRVRMRGSEIHRFLLDLFGERLSRHDVTLSATEAFRDAAVVSFRSSFYPCFVNLMDNALFWLASQDPKRERTIELDVDGPSLTVADTGPGIRARDAEAVFELGFTRRPGGRGMGLYISRQTLHQVGYDLTLDRFEEGRGARFRISPSTNVTDANDTGRMPEEGGDT